MFTRTKVICVSKSSGVGKTSGQPYEMCELTYLQGFRGLQRPNRSVVGAGFTAFVVSCTEEVFREFAQFGEEEFPVVADLEFYKSLDREGKPRDEVVTCKLVSNKGALKAA